MGQMRRGMTWPRLHRSWRKHRQPQLGKQATMLDPKMLCICRMQPCRRCICSRIYTVFMAGCCIGHFSRMFDPRMFEHLFEHSCRYHVITERHEAGHHCFDWWLLLSNWYFLLRSLLGMEQLTWNPSIQTRHGMLSNCFSGCGRIQFISMENVDARWCKWYLHLFREFRVTSQAKGI